MSKCTNKRDAGLSLTFILFFLLNWSFIHALVYPDFIGCPSATSHICDIFVSRLYVCVYILWLLSNYLTHISQMTFKFLSYSPNGDPCIVLYFIPMLYFVGSPFYRRMLIMKWEENSYSVFHTSNCHWHFFPRTCFSSLRAVVRTIQIPVIINASVSSFVL